LDEVQTTFGTSEVEQARQAGDLADLGLALRARAQVLAVGAVVVVGQATEHVRAKEHVQVV
jgi:hypothetical protein